MNIAVKIPFTWTDEATATAARMWNEGKTSTSIAALIGTSRNAVISKAHRTPKLFNSKEGLGKGGTGAVRFSKARDGRQSVVIKPAADRRIKLRNAEAERKAAAQRQAIREAREAGTAYDAERLPLAKTLVDLGAKECHWPMNDGGPFLFCASEATHGDQKGNPTYCRCHYLRRLPLRSSSDLEGV